MCQEFQQADIVGKRFGDFMDASTDMNLPKERRNDTVFCGDELK